MKIVRDGQRVARGRESVTGNDKIEHASLTDVGVRRSHNQDAHAVLLAGDDEHFRQQGHVFLVADGMGAHAVGELASELAASIIPLTYHKHAIEDTELALQKAFVEANASIYARGQQNREFQGMGTTGTVLVLRPEGAWIGHVGDSRAYRLRDGMIEQLSFDHSLVWELSRRMKVKPESLQGVPSNVIIRSLGPELNVEVDVEGPHPLRDGDIYVLCSDGLSGQVSDTEIGAIASNLPPAEACQFLVDLANLRGGPDNITVLIVRINGLGDEDGAAAAQKHRPFISWAMWPIICLIAGVALSLKAIALIAETSRSAYVYFSLAVAAIFAGLAGVIWHSYKEKTNPAPRRSRGRLRVYSQSPGKVDRPMLERLIKAEAALRQLISDRGWETDWATNEKCRLRGEEFLKNDDIISAFREYCRSLRPMTDVVGRYRHKEEVFQPIWDKKAEEA